MLDERVPSERAQYLWARYWADRMARLGLDLGPDEVVARARGPGSASRAI